MRIVNKLLRLGRMGEFELTDDEIREVFNLKDKGLVKHALFKENRAGELRSLHPYFYFINDRRFMNGFCSEI